MDRCTEFAVKSFPSRAHHDSLAFHNVRFAEQMLQGKLKEGSTLDKQNYK